MKLCKDCKWHRGDKCWHPNVCSKVTGEPRGWRSNPIISREQSLVDSFVLGACGKRGRWWQTKGDGTCGATY
jgi:hypothetical protein